MEYYSTQKKRRKSGINNNMDRPGGRYGKLNKPCTDGQIQYNLTYMRNRRAKLIETESGMSVSGAGGEENGEMIKVPIMQNK